MEHRGTFGSKIGVILASAGSAVGLGNIWRFPTEVGNNGGAAFILIYLASVLFIGLPIMVSEFVIGRHTHANTATAYQKLAPGKWWRIQGAMGVLVAFIIMCYYSVISGWTLYYAYASLAGMLSDGSQDFTLFFQHFVSNPYQPVLFAVIVMAMVHAIIVRGVQRGIEKFSKVMMPLLFVIILVLVFCAFTLPGAGEGLRFLLKPDFSKVTAGTFLSAIGQAFYSLSLAMGCLCTYASYFRKDTNLVKTACSVGVIDTMVALLAGFIIFPAVFSVPGVEPQAGPGLVFMSLPYVFTQAFHAVPWIGYMFSFLFYVLLFLAALTSAMSIHEPVTAYLHEAHQMSRRKAAWCVSVVCLTLGVFCSLSNGVLSDFKIFGLTLIDTFDAVPAKVLLPLGGIIISLFTGWYLDRNLLRRELTNNGQVRFPFFGLYVFLLRWIIPVAIGLIFVAEMIKTLTGKPLFG